MSPVKACLSLSSCFVKQGKILCSSKKKPHVGILHESSDWKLSVDFDSSLVFPSSFAITGSRPDLLCSEKEQRQTAHCVLSRFAPLLMFSLAAKLLSVRVDILSVTIRF